MVTRQSLECPVMKNPEVATRYDKNAATEVLRQSTCMIRRMGPRKFDNAMCCVANAKNRLHAVTLLATSKSLSQKVQPKQCSTTLFLRLQNIFFENISLATRETLSFSGHGENVEKWRSSFC